MRRNLLFAKKIKAIAFSFLLVLVFVSCKNVNSGSGYSVAKIVDDANSPSGKTTTWQCIYFGSFPQIEILDDTKNNYTLINFGTYPNREIINNEILHDKDFNLLEGDYIVDDDLYSKLESGEWQDSDICSIMVVGDDKYIREKRERYHGSKNEDVAHIVRDDDVGAKHREPFIVASESEVARIVRDDDVGAKHREPFIVANESEVAHIVRDDADKYFHYSYNGKEYHYFKIEPIVWRVLEDVDGIKTLMTNKVIDNVQFSNDLNEACYDNSSIRKWLNSDKNYLTAEAFTENEKNQMIDFKLDRDKMKNNYYFGTKSTSDEFEKEILEKEKSKRENELGKKQINDKFYLLSEEELFYGKKAKVYGFSESDAVADVNRRFGSTAYAKFKGVWFSDKKETLGNCFYMTRTTGYDQSDVVYVDENGAIFNRGINVKTDDMGFLPVVCIKSE